MQFASSRPAPDESLRYFATAAQGIEVVTAQELTRLGATDVGDVPGGVNFSSDLRTLYRVLIGLRTATRVLRPLREFAAINQEMLYSQVRRIRWEDYLNPQMTFAVQTTMQTAVREQGAAPPKGANRDRRGDRRGAPGAQRDSSPAQGITHSQFASLKIKDAIVDRLRREQGARPNVDRENPNVLVHAHFVGGRCTINLDAVGSSLHERGYRSEGHEAPLKETLAAAIVLLSGWDGRSPFYDPFCGSGTLAIEAALIGLDIAPGLFRERYSCQHWPDFNQELWNAEVSRARDQQRGEGPPIFASDLDNNMLAIAQSSSERAGVGDDIRFFPADATKTSPPTSTAGYIVTNPPYGERLGTEKEVAELYRKLGVHWLQNYSGWRASLFAGNLSLAKELPLTAFRKDKLRNGPLECRLLHFQIER